MLKHLELKNFSGVAHFATSALMTHHKGRLSFSEDKPTVVIGPNGSGKSALLTTLAIRFLAYYMGVSTLDGKFVKDQESEAWWTNSSRWGHDYAFLKGLDLVTDNAPAVYYRPGHIPGNEGCLTTSMMLGYWEHTRAYARAVENRSSGQGNRALLERAFSMLQGRELPVGFERVSWNYPDELVDLASSRGYVGPWDHKAEVLKSMFLSTGSGQKKPLLLMDEPEQSLDALAELSLWQALAKADCTGLQVIVATHSLYPLLHPEQFHVIEAVPGYRQKVQALL